EPRAMAEPVVPKRRRLGFSEIPRKVRWIIYANAAGGVGFGYLMIFITAYYPQIGIGSGTIGLILGSEGASMVVCAVPLGIYSDRRGRKSPLLVASAVLPPTILVFAFIAELPRDATRPGSAAEGDGLEASPEVLEPQRPDRPGCRFLHSPRDYLALPEVRRPGHLERPAPGALQYHDRPLRRRQCRPCEAI